MSSPIPLLLVEDHRLFRESLVRLLKAGPALRSRPHCASIARRARFSVRQTSMWCCSIMIWAMRKPVESPLRSDIPHTRFFALAAG